MSTPKKLQPNNSGEYKRKYNTAANQHKIHLKFYPSPQRSAYGIVNKQGVILYIGSSDRTAYRLAQHLKYKTSTLAKRLPEGCTYIIMEDLGDHNDIEMEIQEQHFMDLLKPTENKQRAISIKRYAEYLEADLGNEDKNTE